MLQSVRLGFGFARSNGLWAESRDTSRIGRPMAVE